MGTDIFRCVGFDLLDPFFQLLKAIAGTDVVDHYCGFAIFVVYPCNGSVSFLAGCVPKLKFYFFCLDYNRLLHVDGPQSGVQGLVELVLDVPEGEAALADTHRPHNHNFELQLVFHMIFYYNHM